MFSLIIGADMMYIRYYYKKNYNHDKNFLDMCVLAPGGTHDATHLRKLSF